MPVFSCFSSVLIVKNVAVFPAEHGSVFSEKLLWKISDSILWVVRKNGRFFLPLCDRKINKYIFLKIFRIRLLYYKKFFTFAAIEGV